MQRIILASQSPRRKQLLEWANVKFEILVEETDESYPNELSLNEIPIFIAKNKARAIQGKIEGEYTIIIAADTIVTINQKILGKPKSRAEAIEFLSLLNNCVHEVITGVTILKGEECVEFYDITQVEFHKITTEQIEYYIDQYKPYDKAGAYGIQEWMGVVGIKKIIGDFYNVMGLPVSRVVKTLNSLQNNLLE